MNNRSLGETNPLVDSWQFDPDRFSSRSLVVSLDSTAYLHAVEGARIEVHWFVTGDYDGHYVGDRGTAWFQCRCDRHPKTDAPKSHFHPPPNANGVEPSPLGDHHLDVPFSILDWVSGRVEQLHDQSNRAA